MLRAAVLLLLSLPASGQNGDPVRTDPAPSITVFTDGPHVVTLVERRTKPDIEDLMNQKVDGVARGHFLVRGPLRFYMVRMRFIDGVLVCEKWAERPKLEHEYAERAALVFAQSCG